MITKALEELVSRGHCWHDLIDGYPVGLVQNLCRAANENKKRDLIERTISLSVAMSNAIDLAFGGKGKALEFYIESLTRVEPEETAGADSKNVMSDRARQFFQGLPMKKD